MARQFLNTHSLNRLIAEGEHQQQDFKYKITDACKLAKSVSAFANTEGGRLLIGIRDDGHLSGVRSEEEVYMMRVAATDYCVPAVTLDFDRLQVEGRQIVVANVPLSTQKPVKAICEDGRKRAYIRIADENIVASPVHLQIWRQQQAALGQVFSYGETENRVMAAMNDGRALTLKEVVKLSGVSRHQVVVTLARMVRFGLVDCLFQDHGFVFQLL